MDSALSSAVPILRSFSEAEARDFYLRFLGFEVEFEHRIEPGFPLYMGIRCGQCLLHISEHHGDSTPGSRARIRVADLGKFHQEIIARGPPRLRPGILEQTWGDRELMITDPFGNALVFWEPIKR